MKKHFSFLKTTLIGGVVFLLPLVLVVVVVAKGYQIMKMVAEPLNRLIPIESIGGIALVNLLAVMILLLLCFISGFLARSFVGQRLFDSVDQKLHAVPGYALFKTRVIGNIGSEQEKEGLKPVKVLQGERYQIGFFIEATSDGYVAVFIPTAPDPWSGNIVYCKENQIETLDLSVFETIEIYRSLGRGSERIS